MFWGNQKVDQPHSKLGPGTEYHTQRQGERTFSLSPLNSLCFASTINALDSSGRINQRNGDTPERNMLPASFIQCVVPRRFVATRGTNNPASLIGKQVNHYFIIFSNHLFDAMSLESQRFRTMLSTSMNLSLLSYRTLTNRKYWI